MTRTYEITPRPNNLGFTLKLMESGIEMGGGIFPVEDKITEAEAFDAAMIEAEAWVEHGRDYRSKLEQDGSRN
jgi:hypothetical protein